MAWGDVANFLRKIYLGLPHKITGIFQMNPCRDERETVRRTGRFLFADSTTPVLPVF